MPDRYEFPCGQLFNEFGAPGIPNTYRAVLYLDGKHINCRDFWFRARAERQCQRWARLYDAKPRSRNA
jgi:hypothetical protein